MSQSSPSNAVDFRIVFYGQSITVQDWYLQVVDRLRSKYPYVKFDVRNLAVPGFQAAQLERLVRTDIIPLQPDLVILQTYGHEGDTARLLDCIRSNTTSDILLQNDHISYFLAAVISPDDPEFISADDPSAFRNYVWLPKLATQFDACFVNVRDVWKSYLKAAGATLEVLLGSDLIHLNADGNQLMADIVMSYLSAQAPMGFDPWDCPRVRNLEVGQELQWKEGILRIPVSGNAIALELATNRTSSISIKVDGNSLTNDATLVRFTRTSTCYNLIWPAILQIRSETVLVPEDWTLTLTSVAEGGLPYTFRVVGSVTGEDGEGSSEQSFRSKSGRVIFRQQDQFMIAGIRNLGSIPPVGFEVKWRAEQYGVDYIDVSDNSNPIRYIVWGLSDSTHIVELTAGEFTQSPVTRVRVYSSSGRSSPGQSVDRMCLRSVNGWHWLVWPIAPTNEPAGVVEFSTQLESPIWNAVIVPPVVTPKNNSLLWQPSSTNQSVYYRLRPR